MTRCGAVLVVDDGEINRALLTELLEHEGYEVREVPDGAEAPAALENSAVEDTETVARSIELGADQLADRVAALERLVGGAHNGASAQRP